MVGKLSHLVVDMTSSQDIVSVVQVAGAQGLCGSLGSAIA